MLPILITDWNLPKISFFLKTVCIASICAFKNCIENAGKITLNKLFYTSS